MVIDGPGAALPSSVKDEIRGIRCASEPVAASNGTDFRLRLLPTKRPGPKGAVRLSLKDRAYLNLPSSKSVQPPPRMPRLADFIRHNTEHILSEWETFARSLPMGS